MLQKNKEKSKQLGCVMWVHLFSMCVCVALHDPGSDWINIVNIKVSLLIVAWLINRWLLSNNPVYDIGRQIFSLMHNKPFSYNGLRCCRAVVAWLWTWFRAACRLIDTRHAVVVVNKLCPCSATLKLQNKRKKNICSLFAQKGYRIFYLKTLDLPLSVWNSSGNAELLMNWRRFL